ncbi:MAG: hypothetical protein QXS54_12640 [Candidatus Methanomethylicaceae archaeon]
MAFLCLSLEPELRVGVLQKRPGAYIVIAGQRFLRMPVEEVLFYDWIVAAASGCLALEIHVEPDHPLVQTELSLPKLSYLDRDPFVRIWLTQRRGGVPMGKEAFGDLFFFQGAQGALAIVVGIEEWLSSREREVVLSILRREYGWDLCNKPNL